MFLLFCVFVFAFVFYHFFIDLCKTTEREAFARKLIIVVVFLFFFLVFFFLFAAYFFFEKIMLFAGLRKERAKESPIKVAHVSSSTQMTVKKKVRDAGNVFEDFQKMVKTEKKE